MPESLQVTAAVTFEPGEGVTGSHLLVSAKVPGISEEDFQRIAEDAKANCPISKALGGTPITLEAALACGSRLERGDARLRVLVAGASGFIGRELRRN